MLATTPSRIVDSLITQGPTHRADLARKLLVSRTAVSNAVDHLLERGLVSVAPRGAGVTTLKDQILMTPRFGLIGAVVIDFDETLIGIGTLDGRLLGYHALPGGPQMRGTERILAAPASISHLREQVGSDAPLLFTQLAVNTQAHRDTGEVLGGSASTAWMDTNPKQLLEEVLGCPVRLENTARLLALAEQQHRPAASDLVYVQLSYGVAMGQIVDGRILGGSRGGAGELGHTSIDLNGRPCSCAGRGCMMQYIGRHALIEDVERLLGRGADVPDLILAGKKGDHEARALLAEFGRRVGEALVGLCNLLEPSTLVIGGCLSDAGETFLDPVRQGLRGRALPQTVDELSIETATGSLVRDTVLRAALRCLRDDTSIRADVIHRSINPFRTRHLA
ncbi:MAG TPA: ROK family transcriptional regulator [Actinomycetaceae bacterium]|nr:ROK family transcriptional regulator [Actinomycetaceae bacterium]